MLFSPQILARSQPRSVGGGGTTDPNWTNVKLLMSFDSNFNDESSAAHGTMSNNNVVINSVNSVFGNGINFNSTGIANWYTYHADWDISNVPFTMEVRIYMTTTGTTRMIMIRDNGTNSWTWKVNASNALEFDINGTLVCSGGSLSINTPYAVCVDFDGSKYRLYVGGSMVGSSTSLVTASSGSAWLFIGSTNGGSAQFWGTMDELRFTKAGRYVSDGGYTVATSAFPRS